MRVQIFTMIPVLDSCIIYYSHKKYHKVFWRMLQIAILLNSNYSNGSDIEDISEDCVIEVVNEMNFDSFANLYLEIENTSVKNLKWEDRRETKL